MMLDYKGWGGFKILGKSDYVICEHSQIQPGKRLKNSYTLNVDNFFNLISK